MRQQTTRNDRRLSAERLNDRRRNRPTAAILTSSASALVGGQPSRAGPSPASTGRAAAAGREARMAADQLITFFFFIFKEFYNKTPSHDTGHGTGAHWH